jgi:hypothetical protein
MNFIENSLQSDNVVGNDVEETMYNKENLSNSEGLMHRLEVKLVELVVDEKPVDFYLDPLTEQMRMKVLQRQTTVRSQRYLSNHMFAHYVNKRTQSVPNSCQPRGLINDIDPRDEKTIQFPFPLGFRECILAGR